MSDAFTMPKSMMMASIVSEDSLARDTHRQTDTQKDRQTRVVYVKICTPKKKNLFKNMPQYTSLQCKYVIWTIGVY